MSTAFKQDMPPAGGYAPIYYDRVPTKKIFNGWWMLGIYLVGSALTINRALKERFYSRKLEIEHWDQINAVMPFCLAERDRLFLKQLRKQREEEAALMADYPGWKVGTLFGEPLFKTLRKDAIPPLPLHEWYAHRPHWDFHDFVWPDKSQW